MADGGVTISGGNLKAGPIQAPVIPLLLVGFGAYFMWFAAHYWALDKTDIGVGSGTLWPSDPVKNVLQGKGPLPTAKPATTAEATLTADIQSFQGGQAPAGTSTSTTTNVSGTPQNIAKLLLSKFGWGLDQMPPLIKLWTQESGWNPKARNPSSGAFGIAQALGHGQAGTAAPDGTNEYGAQYGLTVQQAQQANAGSARWQIQWGLGYVKSTYGSPSAAWSHEVANNWY